MLLTYYTYYTRKFKQLPTNACNEQDVVKPGQHFSREDIMMVNIAFALI